MGLISWLFGTKEEPSLSPFDKKLNEILKVCEFLKNDEIIKLEYTLKDNRLNIKHQHNNMDWAICTNLYLEGLPEQYLDDILNQLYKLGYKDNGQTNV